ncbi:hypothetical protein AAG570_002447, partial [Ranatra chinensis]
GVSSNLQATLKKYPKNNQVFQLFSCCRVEGLYGIVISDRDGVPIIRVAAEKSPETILRRNFLSTFGMASHQGDKLGIGKNETIICMFTSYQVIQMSEQALIVTFIGSEKCNTGHILALRPEIQPLLLNLRSVLAIETM